MQIINTDISVNYAPGTLLGNRNSAITKLTNSLSLGG